VKLTLTPVILAGVYESLRVCPPFSRWGLPPAEDIEFRVMKYRDREGQYTRYVGTDHHIIDVSAARIAHYDSLAIVMAHEMIHLVQAVRRLETRVMHNADFRRRAAQVCNTLGFDPHLFC